MAYGTPTDPVAGTVITVAYAVANLLNPIRWLRILTGGADPGGTGYMVTSDSTTTTSWKTGVAAILHVLGYTPVNKAGDSMSNNLSFSVDQKGVSLSGLTFIRDVAAFPGLLINVNGNACYLYDQSGTTQMFRVIYAETAPYFKGQEMWHDGNTTGKVTNAKLGALAVDNPKMAAGAAAANIGYTPARSASGTYSGGGGSAVQKTTGFVPKYVRLVGINGSNRVLFDIVSATGANNVRAEKLTGFPVDFVGLTTTRLHASDGFIVESTEGSDSSGYTYSWVAFG